MYAPAVALTWEFWRRHRLGLSGVVALVATFAIVCAIAPLSSNLAGINSMWFIMGLCYVIGVFAYGFDGKLESAESCFPARLFLLPVRTWMLVGWPMLQGAVVAVLLWLAWDRLVLRPSGIETPAWWTMMLVAVVAISQALVWLPFGVPWLRLLVLFATLIAFVRAPAFLALAGDRYTEPETENRILCAFAIAMIPVAFLIAWVGVGRARHGDACDWLRAWPSDRAVAPPIREPRPFSSATRAQVWYEWRARGRGFAVATALILVAMAALSAATERDDEKKTNFGVMFLLMPAILAATWGTYAGTAGTATGSNGGLSAYAATRPLSNVAFVGAKCSAAGLMAVSAWGVVLILLALWLSYTGGYRHVEGLYDAAVAKEGTARVVAFCALLAIGPVLLTWRTLVVGLWTGLTGRAWVMYAQIVLAAFIALQGLYEWTMWQSDPARRDRILNTLPWIAGVAVVLKFVTAGWLLRELIDRGELTASETAKLLGVWLVLAAALFGMAAWLTPSGQLPIYGIALAVVLVLPLTRLAVAPLAFAWNRHR